MSKNGDDLAALCKRNKEEAAEKKWCQRCGGTGWITCKDAPDEETRCPTCRPKTTLQLIQEEEDARALTVTAAPCGYHIRKIERGVVGEISKIREEFEELMDAHEQGNKIMELIELSDMLGAIELYMKKHHKGTSISDLQVMSATTQRAFASGARK